MSVIFLYNTKGRGFSVWGFGMWVKSINIFLLLSLAHWQYGHQHWVQAVHRKSYMKAISGHPYMRWCVNPISAWASFPPPLKAWIFFARLNINVAFGLRLKCLYNISLLSVMLLLLCKQSLPLPCCQCIHFPNKHLNK